MALSPEIEKRLNASVSLPTPPRLATEIIELSRDPDISLPAVAKTISNDPALTGKVLRIANSAVYAGRREATNLRQAVITLGLNSTITLALSFSLASGLRTQRSGGLNYDAYWERSIVTSAACRAIAGVLRSKDAEELFLAGLLQDLGMLALDKVAPDLYVDIGAIQADHAALCAHEVAAIGSDHAEVGAWMLTEWKIPSQIALAVEFSHDAENCAGTPAECQAAKVLSVSNDFADVWLHGEFEQSMPHLVAQANSLLALEQEEVIEIIAALKARIAESEEAFNLKVASAIPAEDILEQAREALMIRNIMAIQEVNSLKTDFSTLEKRTQALEEEGRRDGLTGVFNRAYFDDTLVREFKAAKDSGWPLSLVFVDLDHFKNVNDTYGHQAGDQVLRNAAANLVDAVRDTDTVARYGGEEFVVILAGCSGDDMVTVCGRILEKFRTSDYNLGPAGRVNVTASLGGSTLSATAPFASPAELLAAADQCVYIAKRGGRNRAEYYAPPDAVRRTG